MGRKVQIAVIGAGEATPEVREWAVAVGKQLATAGATIICGGLGGVMEAVAQGAAEGEGLCVGILPSYEGETANPFVSVVLPSGLGHARNVVVVAAGDAVIAFPGAYGTLAEIALALKLGKSVIGLRAWESVEGVIPAHTPEDAVRLAVEWGKGKWQKGKRKP